MIPSQKKWKIYWYLKKNKLIIYCTFFFGALFLSLLNSHMLYQKEDGWYSGGSTWADLAVHLSIISSFSERGINTLTDNPVYAGSKLNYPFVMDLISAIFYKIGFSIQSSLIIPALTMLLILVILIFKLTYKITKSKTASFFVPFLFFLNGSLFGIYYFWQDKIKSGLPLLDFLNQMQIEYAHLGDYNIRFSNIIADYILPQRAIILGLLVGIVVVYFFWEYWEGKKQISLIKAGLFTVTLPLIHTHTFITMAFLSGFLFLIDLFLERDRKIFLNWLSYFAIVFLLGIPQLLLISPEQKSNFIKFYIGWVREKNESLIWFWTKNLFPHIFIFLAGFMVAGKKLKSFYFAFFAVFILTNIIIFQPHNYDNMKIMLYWFLLSCILVGVFFESLFKKFSKKSYLIITPLFILLTLTGFLSVYRESYVSWQMFSKEDIVFASFIKNNTQKNALFLTSDQHNGAISSLSGRKILMGYRGWLWTYGIDYSEREGDIYDIYKGNDLSKSLISKYKIDYILIEELKKNQYAINSDFFEKNYKAKYRSKNYVLYKISR